MAYERKYKDLSDVKVFIGISGGINSAAVLCYLATIHPAALRPRKVYMFYAHLMEHSDDTLPFVDALVEYARQHFEVDFEMVTASVNEFFVDKKFIPHPRLSPCSEHLKMIPIMQYKARHDIDLDLVGYVHHERLRRVRQQNVADEPEKYYYPITHMTDDECLDLVRREIGWYPALYDIRDDNGTRVFKHNNCLPCKNMNGRLTLTGATRDYAAVEKYYPAAIESARATIRSIEETTGKQPYWGRPDTDTASGCNDYVCE